MRCVLGRVDVYENLQFNSVSGLVLLQFGAIHPGQKSEEITPDVITKLCHDLR
jgi:hypothetical protein